MILAVLGSAGATGLGTSARRESAFPGLQGGAWDVAGIFALSMLEVIPHAGFFVFGLGYCSRSVAASSAAWRPPAPCRPAERLAHR